MLLQEILYLQRSQWDTWPEPLLQCWVTILANQKNNWTHTSIFVAFTAEETGILALNIFLKQLDADKVKLSPCLI
jgi:hypothetical protein